MSKKFIVFLICVLLIAGLLSWLISLDSKKEPQQTAAPQETIAVQAVETAQPAGQVQTHKQTQTIKGKHHGRA